MSRSHVLRISAAVVFAAASPGIAEIGAVFKVGGLSASYNGALPLFTVTGIHRPLYWRPPGHVDFSPYGTNVSFSLTATGITWSTPTSSIARASYASLKIDPASGGLSMVTCEGAGALDRENPPGGADRAGPGLFFMAPTGGSLSPRFPFTLTWAEGAAFDQVFTDWTRSYTGTVEAWFYWAVPEPSTAGLGMVGAALLMGQRLRRRQQPQSASKP